MNRIHQVRVAYTAFKCLVNYRKNWFALVLSSQSAAQIDWGVKVTGQIILSDNVVLEDGCLLDAVQYSSDDSYIKLGANSKVRHFAQIYTWGGFVSVGEDSSINSQTVIYGTGGVEIGKRVMIAAHNIIVASSHNIDSPDYDTPIKSQGYSAKGIIIEDDVWIGAGCKILDGVRIGKGAVIGAGSVVTRNVSSYDVAIGAPAKTIRSRKSQ